MNGTTQTMHVEASEDWLDASCPVAGSTHPSTHHTAPKPTTMSSPMATSRRMRRDSSTGQFIYCHGVVMKLCAVVLSLLREPALVCEKQLGMPPQSAGRPQAAIASLARFGVAQNANRLSMAAGMWRPQLERQ